MEDEEELLELAVGAAAVLLLFYVLMRFAGG
jgi:hypothetical protein